MKRNLITLIGAVAIVAGVVAFNARFEGRRAENPAEAAETEATAEMDETEIAEAAEGHKEARDKAKGNDDDANELAPYKVKFETSKGDFVVAVDPSLAPIGAAHFKDIVENHVYDDARIFRVLPGFVVQWGIAGDPAVAAKWQKTIKDEPVKEKNTAGTITFAKSNLPNSRSSQVFINLGDNTQLDSMGFSPFGKVLEGMDVVKALNSEYGESLTNLQGQIQAGGNAFLAERAPNLDYIKSATVIEESATQVEADSHAGHNH